MGAPGSLPSPQKPSGGLSGVGDNIISSSGHHQRSLVSCPPEAPAPTTHPVVVHLITTSSSASTPPSNISPSTLTTSLSSFPLNVLYPSTLSHSIANVANPRPLVRGRCLWDIPGEVRNLIYSSVLTELPRRINVARDRSSCSGTQNPDTGYITPQFPFANCLPGIAYTCKQVYQEFVSLYLARAKFELTTMEDVWYFEGFLNTVPWGCGWHAVAHLVFPDFGRLAETPARANEVMDFCRRTPDLGHLELVLNLNGLYLPPIREDSDQINFLRRMRPMKPAEQFALEMDLRSLFDMPNLHTLTVRYRHDGITCTPMNMSAFMDLRDWLISGFVATPGVEVSHEYVDFPRSRDSYITLRISRPDRRASDLQSCGASEASSDALVF